MFGTVLTTIVTILHLYVFWRVGSIAPLTRHLPNRSIALAGLVMWSLSWPAGSTVTPIPAC